jgi:hypothetical protein
MVNYKEIFKPTPGKILLYFQEPISLKEKIHNLYVFHSSEEERNFFKNLKELKYINGFLVDPDGIKYKKKEPLATIDIKIIREYPHGYVYDSSIMKDLDFEEKKIRKQILSLRPRPHGFLKIEHPNAKKLREFLRSDIDNKFKEELEERTKDIDYAIEVKQVSEKILMPAFEEIDAVDTVINGRKFYTIEEPDRVVIQIHRVEFYHLGE